MDHNLIAESKMEFKKELEEDILPFWIKNMIDKENGGFYGCLFNDLKIDRYADKGAILNSRILWTYSKAYNRYKDESYLRMAHRAYDYMLEHFWDKEYSGLYWMLDYKGKAVQDKKQVYNLAFGIYGLSEYYMATQGEESLKKAIELFRLIERYSYDAVNKGYVEALSREWKAIDDMRLSPKDLNSKKSMNTHLHILEAYTNLFRVWRDESLKRKLEEVITVIMDYILDEGTYQFKLFFDEKWNCLKKLVSYGHDIEGSWLLQEAAEVAGNESLISRAKEIAVKMAEKVLQEGIHEGVGGIYNERREDGTVRQKKDWWPQAEAVVGFMNAHELSGEDKFLNASISIWNYIKKYFVDRKYGEWFNEISFQGEPDNSMAKADAWKCPYHNSRACFEMIERLDRLKNSK